MFRFIQYRSMARIFRMVLANIISWKKLILLFRTRSSRPHPCWSSGLPATQRTGVNFAGWFAIGRPCNRLMWDLTLNLPATLTFT